MHNRVYVLALRQGEYIMGYYKNLLIEQAEEHVPTWDTHSEFEELDFVQSEISIALSNGDYDRAKQLASLIDINVQ